MEFLRIVLKVSPEFGMLFEFEPLKYAPVKVKHDYGTTHINYFQMFLKRIEAGGATRFVLTLRLMFRSV